jgi:hypothetical protein
MAVQRVATTLRVPAEILEQARRVKPVGQSLNEFLGEIVAKEVKQRHTVMILDDLHKLGDEISARRAGEPWPEELEPVRVIREIREVGRDYR